MNELISTGNMIRIYMEANGVAVRDLSAACNVSERRIYGLLNDESRLTSEVASGLKALIPGISEDFLFTYEEKYQLQKVQNC